MLFRLCYCGDLDSVHVFTDQSGGNVTNTETQDFTKRPFKAFLQSLHVFLDITFFFFTYSQLIGIGVRRIQPLDSTSDNENFQSSFFWSSQ